MNEYELRKLKPGDITFIDGHIAWVESVDENRIAFFTCSISFTKDRGNKKHRLLTESEETFRKILKENDNEKDETDKSDQPSYQNVIG